MSAKPNHSPTPWWVAYGQIWSGDGIASQISVAKPDRDEPRTSPTERDANAEFICRAVNEREELIVSQSALLRIASRIEELADSGDIPNLKDWVEMGQLRDAVRNTRAALAKAKGGAA